MFQLGRSQMGEKPFYAELLLLERTEAIYQARALRWHKGAQKTCDRTVRFVNTRPSDGSLQVHEIALMGILLGAWIIMRMPWQTDAASIPTMPVCTRRDGNCRASRSHDRWLGPPNAKKETQRQQAVDLSKSSFGEKENL